MMNLSDIIGKKVVSMYDLKCCGTVTNILLDSKSKRAKYAIIVEEDDNENITWVLNMRDIFNIFEDVSIKNISTLRLKSEMDLELLGYHNPLCNEAYDTLGRHMGVVTDLVLDESHKVTTFSTSVGNFTAQDVVCFNSNILLIKNEAKKYSSFAPRKSLPTKTIDTPEVVTIQPVLPSILAPNTYPNRYVDKSTLLGRTVTRVVADSSGFVIARPNQMVNDTIIENARLAGKLRTLQECSIRV